MTGYLGARRRIAGTGGWLATIPQADHDHHGAGYPITYRFDLPPGGPYTAQFRTRHRAAWTPVPTAPPGRFDGITAARYSGDHAYVSMPFGIDSNQLWLRIIDAAGHEVTTTAPEVLPLYDDRACAVVFTYDDNGTRANQVESGIIHRATRLWMSPGLNPGLWTPDDQPWETGLRRVDVETLVAAGYYEPANHSLAHKNSSSWSDLADARVQVVDSAEILAQIQPPQSRGRCLGYYYPNGFHNELAYQVCGEAGHLSARLVGANEYGRAPWSDTWGLVHQQNPSIAPGTYSQPPAIETQQVEADKLAPAVAHAKSVRGQCIIYAYTYYWDWGADDPWPQALAAVGAMDDIWSVGYGHLALYQRTAERITITPA